MNATVALPLEHPSELKPLKPMGLIESILLFGIPAVVLAASLWLLWPVLVDAGMDGATAYAICLSWVIPFIAQRTKNTWPGIIAHASLNSAGPVAEIILTAMKLL